MTSDISSKSQKEMIHKEKSQGKSLIIRHNTRPKRSNAGERSEKWKEGWVS